MVTDPPGAIGDVPRRVRTRRAGIIAAIAALALLPATAVARDLSRAELSSRLAGDPAAALAGLEDVTTFDGVPVDIQLLLADAGPRDAVARLRALGARAERPPKPDDARNRANRILDNPPFGAGDVSDDGEGVGWSGNVGIVVLAVFAVLGGLLAFWLARRRMGTVARTAAEQMAATRAVSPADLDRQAEDAERRGDLTTALRLIFQAGVARLQERGTLARPGDPLTSNRLRREVRSTRFDALVRRFDAIVYGGAVAEASDVREAREGWAQVTGRAR